MKRKGLRFYAKIYCRILAQDLKSKMSYRADFIISTIGKLFLLLSFIVLYFVPPPLMTEREERENTLLEVF